jgi:hypothetical protein
MEFHSVQLTYPELKYLLEYLQDNRAKQIYLNNCLEDNSLDGISRRLSYLQNVEDILLEAIETIKTTNNQYGSIKFNRNQP